MNISPKVISILYKTGAVAVVIGMLDPLEGSVVIAAGSTLLAFSALAAKNRFRNWFITAWLMVIAGVFYLFYISSLGGFLGNTGRSWVWGLPVLPYPLGWIMIIVLLIKSWLKKKSEQPAGETTA